MSSWKYSSWKYSSWKYSSWKHRCGFLLLMLLTGSALADNRQIAEGGAQQIGVTTIYDPAYVRLAFPNGDLPLERGVCSDVVIRALRHSGQDLQQLVNRDMAANFSLYPKIWGLKSTDRNIDHRRVPNLETYFTRQGMSLAVSQNERDYLPGDIVSWRLDNGLPHIGIVADIQTDKGKPLVIHNIGYGAQLEDVLFSWKVIGHYRYYR